MIESSPDYTTTLETSPLSMPLRRSRKIARWISAIFSPPLISVFAVFLMTAFTSGKASYGRAAGYAFLAIGLPVLLTLWMMHKGNVSDFHISIHKERTRPMVFMILSAFISWLFLWFTRPGPDILTIFAGIAVLHIIFLFLVTLRWKISGHASAISGLCVFLVAYLGVRGLPFMLLIPLVVWARVMLRRHTLKQTMAGALAGAVFTFLALYIIFLECHRMGFRCV
jgi:membrane-associated phospholipid phosphatase